MSNEEKNGGCLNLGCGCGCFLLILAVLIASGPIGWGILAILAILVIIGGIKEANKSDSNNNSSQSSATSSTSSKSSTSTKKTSQTSQKSSPFTEEIKKILIDISQGEIRDMISQEFFKQGEKVHLCSVHKLAYHEDSWQEIGCKCESCGHGQKTHVYTVPTPVNTEKINWKEVTK